MLLCASLLPAVQAKAKTTLPDACGDDSVQFDVTTKKNQPVPAPPPAGKAQIVFVETMNKPPICLKCDMTARYGIDRSWVGSNKGSSYFIVEVDPGVHHLCVSPENRSRLLQKDAEVTSVTTEAGKTYYYEATITYAVYGTNGPEGTSTGGGASLSFVFSQLSEDEGKYRVKAWTPVSSKPKK